MTLGKYIWHITLNTGDVRQSPRSEVGDDIIEALQPLLIADGTHKMPVPGYTLKVSRLGSNLIATVMQQAVRPFVTIGIATRSTGAARLWQELHKIAPTTVPHTADMPSAPWCAALLHTAVEQDIPATSWLGDFERCLAWAWIEARNP